MIDKVKRKLLGWPLFFRNLKRAQRVAWKVKASAYRRRRESLRRRIFGRDVAAEPLRVLFFVTNMSLWKYRELAALMQRDPHFHPIIAPFYTPKTDPAIMRRNREAIKAYAEANGLEYADSYDFATGRYVDLTSLRPDLVSYSQPYDYGHRSCTIDAFKRHSLFFYTPYGAAVAEGRQFRDTYLGNVASFIFVGSPIEREVFLKCLPANRDSLIVTGSETFDLIRKADAGKSPWPDNGRRRVIWAPHHSIDDHNSFASSHFERLANAMLALADKYSDTVEFAFKPHPVLRTRLYEKWGRERTDAYYDEWSKRPNTFLADGEYTALFAFSDAMIHDCSSFAAEYLITGKPVFYVTDSDKPGVAIGNEYGQQCFNLHYRGHTVEEIEAFITQTVIGGKDRLKPARLFFIDLQLTPGGGTSPGENMLAALSQF